MVREAQDIEVLIMTKELKLDELKLAKKRQELRVLQARKEVERLENSMEASDKAIDSLEAEVSELKSRQ